MISNSGNDSLNHDRMEQYNTLPRLNITSPNTFHHLTNSDVDLNMPVDQNFSYYSIENFKSNYDINECSSNKTSFSALNCNIRSLPANYDNFMHMLSELNFPFSLLGFSETKFKVNQERLVNVNIPGYNLISEPSLSNAGGVAFYVKNNLKFSVRSDITTVDQNFEALWIEIDTIGQPNLVCGILYRHPNGNLDKFMEYMNLTIEKIHQENKLCLFMGDFNIDLLKIDTHITSEKFINDLGSFFFQPQILQPTRITDHSSTLIDNIFFNSIEHFIISGNVVYDLTDHLPNFIIFDKFSTLPLNIKIHKRDYSKLNKEALINDIQSINWHTVFAPNTDPSDMFDSFYYRISEIIDKHIPIKQVSRRELLFLSKPWITPAIKVSIRIKNKLHNKYLKTKSTYYHSKFKYYRNKLNHLLKVSKRKYYNEYFLVNVNDSKRIWNGIKQIVHFKPETSQKIIKIVKNNIEVNDPETIADAFNTYFANVGTNLAKEIPKVQKNPLDYIKSPLLNSFYIFPTTATEIETEISSLKDGKACGSYSIPVPVLKILSAVIGKPLEILFNASFSTGIVPSSLKLANVIPVYKKDSQFCLCNYRPISLLSIFNKLLEKLICCRLLDFLEKEKIFYDKQFGFRTKHSTDHAVLSIIDKIQRAIDDRDFSCGIFLDLSKAFDTVDHTILIKKLECYGIRGNAKNWFTSYLSNRQQTVTVNKITSNPTTISCGIPQGSVLGPVLFLLYINDFNQSSDLFDFHLFADDANLFYRHKSLSILESDINNELVNINTWLCANKLSLNIKKSNFVLFHPPQRKITLQVKLYISGTSLQKENCIKYLGIMIDSSLSWKSQISCISKKIKRSIGILSKLRYYVGLSILIKLYYALVYPFLIDGIITWGNTYPTTIQPLSVLQKKAVRIMTFSKFDEHSSPLFKKLNIIKLSDLIKYHISIFMFKFHNQLLPSVFNSYFTSVENIHSYNTRATAKKCYYLPKARTNYGLFSVRYQGPKIWNMIEQQIKLSSSIHQFKQKLKIEFFSTY